MAKLYPSIDVINRMKPQPTEGERALLNFLVDNYSDNYDVFFQPFLNGDLPDIILMHKGGGVMIFEVKDWDLDNYSIDQDGKWNVVANHATNYDNPVKQVLKYKENLYNIHIDKLLELHLKDYKYWYVVHCALYFHCHSEADAQSRMVGPQSTDKYKKFIEKNITILGKDSLDKSNFDEIFKNKWISYTRSKYFDTKLYNSFFRILQPSKHLLQEGEEIHLYPPQDELSISVPGQRKRIKGVAGSGKTLILAHRAVDAYQKTQEEVLILTYNITLRNYIHDKISKVRQDFPWRYFHISNYHDFINSQLRNLCLKPFAETLRGLTGASFEAEMERTVYSNLELFSGFEDKLPKYKTILLDEAQDYNENWFRMIMKYFAADNPEIVAFADEKQNVYARTLDSNKELIVPIQTGRWDQRLSRSARIPAKITLLLNRFQETFFSGKYNVQHIEGRQMELGEECDINYISYIPQGKDVKSKVQDVASFVYEKIISSSYAPNDVTLLATRISTLQYVNKRLIEESHENTNVMFETEADIEKIKEKMRSTDFLDRKVQDFRRMRKANFWANRGTYKLSTIFSYKGWESPVLFLLLESGLPRDFGRRTLNEDGRLVEGYVPEKFSDELIYTGLSRCKKDLYIINVDYDMSPSRNAYHDFFSSLPDSIVNKL